SAPVVVVIAAIVPRAHGFEKSAATGIEKEAAPQTASKIWSPVPSNFPQPGVSEILLRIVYWQGPMTDGVHLRKRFPLSVILQQHCPGDSYVNLHMFSGCYHEEADNLRCRCHRFNRNARFRG